MFEATKQTLFWGKALFVTLINRESGVIVFPQQLCREDWEVCLPNCLLENPFVNLHNAATDSYHNGQNNPKMILSSILISTSDKTYFETASHKFFSLV